MVSPSLTISATSRMSTQVNRGDQRGDAAAAGTGGAPYRRQSSPHHDAGCQRCAKTKKGARPCRLGGAARIEAACETATPRRHDRIRWCANNDFAIEMPCKSIEGCKQCDFTGGRPRSAWPEGMRKSSQGREVESSRWAKCENAIITEGSRGSLTRGAFLRSKARILVERWPWRSTVVGSPYLIVTGLAVFAGQRFGSTFETGCRELLQLPQRLVSLALPTAMQPKTRPIQRLATAASKCSAEVNAYVLPC